MLDRVFSLLGGDLSEGIYLQAIKEEIASSGLHFKNDVNLNVIYNNKNIGAIGNNLNSNIFTVYTFEISSLFFRINRKYDVPLSQNNFGILRSKVHLTSISDQIKCSC